MVNTEELSNFITLINEHKHKVYSFTIYNMELRYKYHVVLHGGEFLTEISGDIKTIDKILQSL